MFLLRDCSEYECVYGVVKINSNISVSNNIMEDMQKRIYEIKEQFNNEGNQDWQVDEVLEILHGEFDFEVLGIETRDYLEI